jgi:erythromycin esterase
MTNGSATRDEIDEIASLARPLVASADLEVLVQRIAGRRAVLLGEASHGTSEYYRWRAEITRRLVVAGDARFVAVEGDWPDCFRVNEWVKGRGDRHLSARELLGHFDRWPTWMWANDEVAEFVEWLRDHNARTGADVGFYGLDVYSLWESLSRVMSYLGEHQPDALEAAHTAARCFDPYHEDPQRYARATRLIPTSCEDEVVELLAQMHRGPAPGGDGPEAELDALQNAEVLSGAERYYRSMVRGGGESWNVRDHHMIDTFDRLLQHHGPGAKGVVWEHNTHIGDARGTDMVTAGMVNVGQLARERHGHDDVALVGFGGHHGSVIAADGWGAPMRRIRIPPARLGSHEDLLHQVVPHPALFVFPDQRDSPWLSSTRGHRAIGVVYRPESDRLGNWVPTTMGVRYDAFCYFDETEALHPLHVEAAAMSSELETAPWGV